jgi:hypothetical protein
MVEPVRLARIAVIAHRVRSPVRTPKGSPFFVQPDDDTPASIYSIAG